MESATKIDLHEGYMYFDRKEVQHSFLIMQTLLFYVRGKVHGFYAI